MLFRGRIILKLGSLRPNSRQLSGLVISVSRNQREQVLLNHKKFSPIVHQKATTLSPVRNSSSSPQVLRPYVDSKYSYAYGRSLEHLSYTTIDKELEKRVLEVPDDVIFTSYGENIQVTYKQFNQDVNKLSKSLMKQFNIVKGDSVGVFAYNCYNWLVVQFACSRIGAILTPINPSYKSQELHFILKKGQVKCLFMPGPKSVQSELNDHFSVLKSDDILQSVGNNEIAMNNVVLMDSENSYDLVDGKLFDNQPANLKLHNWRETQQNDGVIFRSSHEAENAVDPCIIDPELVGSDDMFAVYYTSGTTGQPKGACVSQFTAINNVRFCQFRMRGGRAKNWRIVAATCLPMFHIFAGSLTAISPAVANSHVILAGHKYEIETLVKCIIEHRANLITVTPTMLIDLVACVETNKITNFPLRIIQCGGAALPPEMVSKTFKVLPDLEEVRLGYGSTENGAVATFQSLHEPDDYKTSSVGPPIDFTEVRVVHPGSERICKLMETGEIQTRGHNTMIEYLNDPKKTAEVITQNRWYRTGDVGIMYPHGSIQINGRSKHMIIKGGENIYPEEVRQLIHKLKYVEDVHVVGVPDKRFGEQVCAWVKLKQGYNETQSLEHGEDEVHKKDIIKFCKENITYFKVPKYIIFVDDFPMTPTKKAQAHIMTERSIEILGLQDQM